MRMPLKEKCNVFSRENPSSSEKSTDEEREFTVNLGDGGKEHMVKGSIHDSIHTALMTNRDVRTRLGNEKDKEIYLIGKKGIEACINLGMPLKYLPEGCQFEMKFYKIKRSGSTGESSYRVYNDSKKECNIFYIHPSGLKRCRIITRYQLLRERCKLCVFAPEGETIKDALCKDGRFLPLLEEKEWALMKGKTSIVNTYRVDKTLANKSFHVEVKIKRLSQAGGGPNNKQLHVASHSLKASHRFNPDLLDVYPHLKKQSDIIDKYFANIKQQKNIFRVYRENFGKERKDSILIKAMKNQVDLSESVGYIEWDLSQKKGSATCFVLCGRYILTCHHVVKMIVGEGIEEKDWALKISQSARVTFSYKDNHPKDNDWFSIEQWFKISDKDLDFAVLRLEENGKKSPEGLAPFINCPPFNGLIHIIGHPDGQAKSIDSCFVVNICERQRECERSVQQGLDKECNNVNCGYDAQGTDCIHSFNPCDMSGIVNNPVAVTYNTSFFWGSSGSPVFDTNGNLVALHVAGYIYGRKHKPQSIIEFGFSMRSIFKVIKDKFKSLYNSDFCEESVISDVEMECVE